MLPSSKKEKKSQNTCYFIHDLNEAESCFNTSFSNWVVVSGYLEGKKIKIQVYYLYSIMIIKLQVSTVYKVSQRIDKIIRVLYEHRLCL